MESAPKLASAPASAPTSAPTPEIRDRDRDRDRRVKKRARASSKRRTRTASGMPIMTKTSIGIVLCRINETNGRAEAVMVLRRYTYAFVEFVHGRYSRANNARHTKNLIALFEQMTTSELLDIWSLNFDQMWFRVWLMSPQPDLYHKKLAKFQSVFMKENGGRGLRQLLSQVGGRGELWWEFPKGKRQSDRESDINCAIRELQEETRIEKRDYQILPEIKRQVIYTTQGVRYIHVYYMAVALPRLSTALVEGPSRRLTICLKEIDQVGEIADVAWKDIEQIRLIDVNHRLESIVKPLFKIAKRIQKGRFVQGKQGRNNYSGEDPLAAGKEVKEDPHGGKGGEEKEDFHGGKGEEE